MNPDELLREDWERIPTPPAAESVRRFEVVLASSRPRARVRLALTAAALLGVVLIAAPAIGGNGVRRVIEFVSEDPSDELVENLEQIDRGNPYRDSLQLEIGETKLVLRGWNWLGEYKLWVTPTKQGRLCLSFEAFMGGRTQPFTSTCVPKMLRRTLDVYSASTAWEPGVGYVIGRVAPAVTKVRVEYANGGREDIAIQNGFFVATIQGSRLHRGADGPRRLLAFDAAGELVGVANDVARSYGELPYVAERPPVSRIETERTVAAAGDAQLRLSQSRLGGSCGRVVSGNRTWVWLCADPKKPRRPLHLAFLRLPGGNVLSVVALGAVPEGTAVTLEFEDGQVERPTLHDGWFFFPVPRMRYERGARLAAVVVSDGTEELARVPMAVRDDRLYEGAPDPPPMLPTPPSGAAPDWPLVAVVPQATNAGQLRLEVRRKNEREWHERLVLGKKVFGDAHLYWFPEDKDARITAGWLPILSQDGKHDAFVFSGYARRGSTVRAIYRDGSKEAVPAVEPRQPLGGIRRFFLFELTGKRRERGLIRFEAVEGDTVVGEYAVPDETGAR